MSRANIPDRRVNMFHVGQVWETNKGGLWRVVAIENGQAKLRQGAEGSRGRIKRKSWDGVLGMILYYDPEWDEIKPWVSEEDDQ